MVADGYLAGATVFADTNGNRSRDAGELFTTTDSLGNFSFDFGSLTATLVSTGGTDISTGLPFAGSLTAPAGSTVINPLTTLVTAVIEAGGAPADSTALAAAVTAATTQVVAGLGLPVVNLTTFDPLAPGSDAPTALAVQKAAASVANVIVVANAVGAAPATVVRNLATAVTTVGVGQTVNLGSDAVLTTVLTTQSTPTPSAAAVSSLAVANGQIANAVTIDAIAALQTVAQSASTFVAEGAAANTVVFQAATPVGMTAAVFSLKDVPGDDRALISIDAATGAVRLLAPADYETKQTYRFTVVAAQEGRSTVETTVTVAVTNVNEAPTAVSLDDPSVPENSAVGTVVGTLSASDPDAGDTVTYALVAGNGDADNAAFTLDGAILRTARTFNFETRAAYSIRVRATDAAGLSTETSFTIGVTDVPDEALVVERITAQAPASYRAGQRVRFTVTLSEAAQVTGKPQLQLRAGSATKAATYVSGSGSSILTFEYVVGRKDNASAVTIGQNLVFARNSAITAGTEKLSTALPTGVAGAAVEGVRFDAVAPKVAGKVTVPGNG
ncbi:MAG: cadherin repeat domain-containing protein, partial [Actinobacteria bacterium]|nr:cadherin repeat domain-containing protein [Actinomycetota bacterium]